MGDIRVPFSAAPQRWKSSCANQECSLHQLSPYIGKIKSSIAADLIADFTHAGDQVVDPFAGAGTIPLEAAMAGNDPKRIASALGDVGGSKGMSEIARKTGLGRQALHNVLSENRNSTLETLAAVLTALHLELTVRSRAA